MAIRTIKNVDQETWSTFKGLAARSNMKAGEMLKIMVEEYQKKKDNVWNNILKHKSVLTNKEHQRFEKEATDARKEYGWRI